MNDTTLLKLSELPSMLISRFFVLEMMSQQIGGGGRWEMGSGRSGKKEGVEEI